MVPGKEWVALDPTNNQWCGERHVAVSFGRDFADATPLRGTFKGTGGQSMSVKVTMKRIP
jgi:transglutaminase-like putative cysteine protease